MTRFHCYRFQYRPLLCPEHVCASMDDMHATMTVHAIVALSPLPLYAGDMVFGEHACTPECVCVCIMYMHVEVCICG